MRRTRAGAQRHRWADVVVIIASVYAFASAIWSPPELFTGGGGWEVRQEMWLWGAYALGGLIGIAAVFVALRWPDLARVMVAVAGLVVLSGLFALYRVTTLALVSLGLTGLVLLVTAPFMGRMPTPEEEGKRR